MNTPGERVSHDFVRPSKIKILLALHNGAAALKAQLDSYVTQTGADWSLLVSDDGSVDSGPEMVRAFARAHPDRDVSMIDGPVAGFAQNFLHLLRAAGPDVPYVALSDQDDVWLPGKLERALTALADVPEDVPALYGARTWVCDETLGNRHLSPLFTRPPGFANALVQCIAGGNTMVLNRAALDVAQAASREVGQIVSHDWWLYQIISGVGGQVMYDPEPALLYRQHEANLIGANSHPRARMVRGLHILNGRYREWTDINIAALRASRHRLTAPCQELLDGISAARSHAAHRRLAEFRRAGLYRQSAGETTGLYVAAALGRV